MLIGAHALIYSTDAEADRAFLRDVLRLPHVDVGEGWLIFGLPPAEIAVHPGSKNDLHELYFMCRDVEAFAAGMRKLAVVCDAVRDEGWGLVTQVMLPGGGRLGVYQPRHARPKAMKAASNAPKRVAKPATKSAKKAARSPSRERKLAGRGGRRPSRNVSRR